MKTLISFASYTSTKKGNICQSLALQAIVQTGHVTHLLLSHVQRAASVARSRSQDYNEIWLIHMVGVILAHTRRGVLSVMLVC